MAGITVNNEGITHRISFEDFVLFPLFVVLIILSFKICFRKFKSWIFVGDSEYKCKNKNCIRCRDIQSHDLIARLDVFTEKNEFDEKVFQRLRESMVSKKTVKSGEKDDSKQNPTVLYLKGLFPVQPFHSLPSDVNVFMNNGSLDKVKEELTAVLSIEYLWVHNEVENGIWKLFYFYNQGIVQNKNCEMCPETANLISRVKSFMGKSSFGNAAFSYLSPGTSIKPHYGSTNVRLRCHITLQPGANCTIFVGDNEVLYEKNKIIVFDDSFQHSVVHKGIACENRVILLLDLWHPGVTDYEQKAIEYIYTV